MSTRIRAHTPYTHVCTHTVVLKHLFYVEEPQAQRCVQSHTTTEWQDLDL